jgi:hypothetical protein
MVLLMVGLLAVFGPTEKDATSIEQGRYRVAVLRGLHYAAIGEPGSGDQLP